MKKLFVLVATLMFSLATLNQSAAAAVNRWFPQQHVTKSGKPDRRYNANKHLKKDGSMDMRYKSSKRAAAKKSN